MVRCNQIDRLGPAIDIYFRVIEVRADCFSELMNYM